MTSADQEPAALPCPTRDPASWVAPGAVVVGDVHLAAGTSVWYTSVLRADGDRISLGRGTNVQDGCIVHADPGFPIALGEDVSVGHRAVLHGCTIEDDVLVGMGAIILNGVHVGAGSMIAAGAVVLENMVVPARSLVAGVPGRVRRMTTDEEVRGIRDNASQYRALARRHAQEPVTTYPTDPTKESA